MKASLLRGRFEWGVTSLSERKGLGCSSHWIRVVKYSRVTHRQSRKPPPYYTVRSMWRHWLKISMPPTSWRYIIKATFLDLHPSRVSLVLVTTLEKGGMFIGVKFALHTIIESSLWPCSFNTAKRKLMFREIYKPEFVPTSLWSHLSWPI